MLAYKVTSENLPLITVNNEGVTPEIENETTFFVIGYPDGYNTIVTETEFKDMFIIRMPINEAMGRYLIDNR